MTASILGFPAMDNAAAERLDKLAGDSVADSQALCKLVEQLDVAAAQVRNQNQRLKAALLRVLEHYPPGSPMAAAIGEALK